MVVKLIPLSIQWSTERQSLIFLCTWISLTALSLWAGNPVRLRGGGPKWTLASSLLTTWVLDRINHHSGTQSRYQTSRVMELGDSQADVMPLFRFHWDWVNISLIWMLPCPQIPSSWVNLHARGRGLGSTEGSQAYIWTVWSLYFQVKLLFFFKNLYIYFRKCASLRRGAKGKGKRES